jgi:hypothetical protein
MKSFKQLAVLAIFAALPCAGLRAQTLDMRAQIPFNFYAGDKSMPAGEYFIHEEGAVVFLRTLDDASLSRILITVGAAGRNSSHESKLVFNRYGSEYFLSTIWDSYAEDGRQVRWTAREKELAKRGNVPVPAVITLASSK